MVGTLYICGTPIGNLEDITLRQLRILKEVDLIAAEDTRQTVKLLNYYEISSPLTSYHEFNKKEKGAKIIHELLNGKNVALVSDAGMPCISDPGEDIIDLCYKNNIKVTTVPGATAVVSALILSGITASQYTFFGFLPHNKKEQKEMLESMSAETKTMLLYEAPHRLTKTLLLLKENLGESRQISLVREITKKYEEVLKLTIEEALTYYNENSPRGEYVLVISGGDKAVIASAWDNLTLSEHVEMYVAEGIAKKEAIKLVAKDRNLPKREVYDSVMKK